MEDIILHLLPYLDLLTVTNCLQVNETWKNLIVNNKRFWIRELHALKNEKIYFKFSKTVGEVFEDWKAVFDYYEKEVVTKKLVTFVLLLQHPYNFLRMKGRNKNWLEILSPLHVEAHRGRHLLVTFLFDSPVDYNWSS